MTKIIWKPYIPDNAPEYEDRIRFELKEFEIEDPGDLLVHIVTLSHNHDGPCIVVTGEAPDTVSAEYREFLEWEEIDIAGSDLAEKLGINTALMPKIGD